MTKGPSRCVRWRLARIHVAALVLSALASTAMAGLNYIQEDAQIQGKELHSFTDANTGEQVTLVIGDFHFTVGERELSGRDAVLWIHNAESSSDLHDITVYIEGQARVKEPSGATTIDKMMVVELHVQGRISAKGVMVTQPMAGFPLFARAQEQRAHAGRPQEPETPLEAPPLIITSRPPQPSPPPLPKAHPAVKAATKPAKKAPAPVHFYADYLTSEQGAAPLHGDANIRVTIARGNVYVSQGAPDNDLFLEMRATTAVIYSERRAIPRDARSSAMGGFAAPGGDPNAVKETITGIYLEGDVAIARGERRFQGPKAFYDFTTDRALIEDPLVRMRQPARNIPLYIRAKEGRLLSVREMYFQDYKFSTSDFYTPSYSINADTAYVMDNTRYDEKGVRTGEESFHDVLTNATFNVEGVPIMYTPRSEGDFDRENTAFRRLSLGKGVDSDFGYGVGTEWYLFRLLGLVAPQGFDATLELDQFQRGTIGGVNLHYARQTFSGYSMLYGVLDGKGADNFGQNDNSQDISAPSDRGRWLTRHKQLLGDDWEVTAEVSWLSDRNFLQEFFPDEFNSGKEQETLLYAKKQQDNWAFTSLLQYRLNRFQTQTESAPDLGFYLLGEPVGGIFSYFNESHAGLKKFQPDDDSTEEASDWMFRGDSRNELDLPMHLGPINLVHFVTGRATGWSDKPDGGDNFRPYGQVGFKANTHFWRVYDGVENSTWDVHELRHIVTPQVVGFLSSTGGVHPQDLFPMDPGIEDHLIQEQAIAFGIDQRLQTKRGTGASEHIVDWMRLLIQVGFFGTDSQDVTVPADGRDFLSRPENSIPRDHINGEYSWHVSDSVTFLADTNYDTKRSVFGRTDAGLAVQHDPRLAYYLGVRAIKDLDSTVGTAGFNYQLNRKYSFSLFEQYDFKFDGGENLTTDATIMRKLDRWYAAFTFSYNAATGSIGINMSLYPEGVPEVHIGGNRMQSMDKSSAN